MAYEQGRRDERKLEETVERYIIQLRREDIRNLRQEIAEEEHRNSRENHHKVVHRHLRDAEIDF